MKTVLLVLGGLVSLLLEIIAMPLLLVAGVLTFIATKLVGLFRSHDE